MEYKDIKKNRETFKISENLYECPICQKRTSTKGFIRHVRNHFYERDLTNFHNAAKLVGKNSHNKFVEKYNSNPNKCLYCGNDILATENDKVSLISVKKFCNSSCSAKYNNASAVASNLSLSPTMLIEINPYIKR